MSEHGEIADQHFNTLQYALAVEDYNSAVKLYALYAYALLEGYIREKGGPEIRHHSDRHEYIEQHFPRVATVHQQLYDAYRDAYDEIQTQGDVEDVERFVESILSAIDKEESSL